MKLDSYLVKQLVEDGKLREACSALLAHFGRDPLPPDTKIRVNDTVVREDHILVYVTGHWYEWSLKIGFRDGQFSNYRDQSRAVIWRCQKADA